MPEPKSLKDMTDEELDGEIERKYGGLKGITEADIDDPLVVEFAARIARGQA